MNTAVQYIYCCWVWWQQTSTNILLPIFGRLSLSRSNIGTWCRNHCTLEWEVATGYVVIVGLMITRTQQYRTVV